MRNFSLRRIWTVFKKEVVDNLRDRRSISSSLLTPIFMPVFLIAMIIVLGSSVFSDALEQPLNLPVQGAENAPGLIAFLKQNNVTVQPAPADPESAVREGEVNLVLIVGNDFAGALAEGQPAPLEVVMDSSRTSASNDIQRARSLINAYNGTLATLRLQVRGVSPSLLNVVSVELVDTATPQSQALIFLNMLPFLLIMTVFFGGMYVIIDTTAGERERGSLEPLLINPTLRAEFVLGKLLASLPFALVILALTLFLFWVGFNLVPLEDYVGFQMSIDASVLWRIFWLCVPMVLLASALQIVVASYTRSFKEAQTYLSFLPLIAGLPGAFIAFLPVRSSMPAMMIPTYGQSLLINQMMRGETIQPMNMIVSVVMTLIAAVLLTILAIRLYNREQILYGR